jgi:monovalent cation:H+ antiporter-2, CPA2 family
VQETLVYIAVYLAAAVVAVPISARLGFGSVLGYLAAGVAIGPVFGLVGSETEELRHYAEYGVVLMLFLIGLEMRPQMLWDMRHRLIGLGGLQVGLTLALVALVAMAAGVRWSQAVAVGMVLCLSSTAIVMQTLNEKKLARTEGGRASFAVLLFQDVAVIPLLALIPLLAPWGPPPEGPLGENLLAGQPGWLKGLAVLAAVTVVVVAGLYLTRPLFRFIGYARLQEIEIAAALLFVIGVSVLIGSLGLSPALGTFLAGVVLANSEYRHQLESDIAPFKGLLLGLFFITVGASVDLGLLAAEPLPILLFTLALIAIKAAVLYPLGGLFRLEGRDRLLFTFALAQAGEFGFFLLAFATQTRVLPAEVADTVLMVISLSMFLTPALFVLHDRAGRLFARDHERAADNVHPRGTVIIAGMGRFGQVVNRMLKAVGHTTVVLDSHPEVVARMRALGVEAFYGDVDRPALLEAAGIAQARAVVLAMDDREAVVRMAHYVSHAYPQVRIIARAHDRHSVYRLHAAGVTESVREVFDSSVRAGKYALAALGYAEDEIERIAEAFFEHER